MERSPEIEERLRKFLDALTRGAVEELADFQSDHPGALSIGTAPEEWTEGFQQSVRKRAAETLHGSGNQMATARLEQVIAWAERGFGWAAGRLVWMLARKVPARFSQVWRLEQGTWRIVHHHISIGAPNVEAFGHAVIDPLDDFALERRDALTLHPVASQDGTVTLMFSDIEDSTQLNDRLGDARWIEILAAHDAVVRTAVARQSGIAVKHQGDGFMLGFCSPDDAVRAARDIQRLLPTEVDGEAFRVRIGIHHAKTVVTGDDFFGLGVAYAARIAAAARGGEILISDDSFGELASTLWAEDSFETRLKGFGGTHRVHRVFWTYLGEET